jgi:hypothetical protein
LGSTNAALAGADAVALAEVPGANASPELGSRDVPLPPCGGFSFDDWAAAATASVRSTNTFAAADAEDVGWRMAASPSPRVTGVDAVCAAACTVGRSALNCASTPAARISIRATKSVGLGADDDVIAVCAAGIAGCGIGAWGAGAVGVVATVDTCAGAAPGGGVLPAVAPAVGVVTGKAGPDDGNAGVETVSD